MIELCYENYLYSTFKCIFLSLTYAFQNETPLWSFVDVKEILAWKRRIIWRLSDCNKTRIHNHLNRQRALNHLPKLA